MSSIDNECPGSLKETFQATMILAGLMEQVAFKVNFWIEKMRENPRKISNQKLKDTRWGRWKVRVVKYFPQSVKYFSHTTNVCVFLYLLKYAFGPSQFGSVTECRPLD